MIEQHKWTKSDYLKLALWFFPAAVVTWGIHEVAHWGTGKLLGYDMWITFNQAGPVKGSYDSTFDSVLISMAGPVVTLIQGAVALILINRLSDVRYYAFLFLAFYMRAVAMGLSYTSKPNDEAATSLLLGLPMWVLPSVSVGILFLMTYRGSTKLNVGWKGNVVAYVAASIVVTLVIVLNGIVF